MARSSKETHTAQRYAVLGSFASQQGPAAREGSKNGKG